MGDLGPMIHDPRPSSHTPYTSTTSYHMEEDNYSFDIAEHIKTSTPRNPYTCMRIEIAAYEPDSSICLLACLKAYINKTRDLHNN